MYKKGVGVPQEDVLAHTRSYFVLAQGNQMGFKVRFSVVKEMTRATIEEAQRLFGECRV